MTLSWFRLIAGQPSAIEPRALTGHAVDNSRGKVQNVVADSMVRYTGWVLRVLAESISWRAGEHAQPTVTRPDSHSDNGGPVVRLAHSCTVQLGVRTLMLLHTVCNLAVPKITTH